MTQATGRPVRLPGMSTTLRRAAVAKTTITFEMPGCDGCPAGLLQARWNRHAQYGVKVCDAAEKTVEDGVVTDTVPTWHTHGMSMTVTAPWEGHTGYVTTVAFRCGERAGDEVGFREARSTSMASACWSRLDGVRRGHPGLDGADAPGVGRRDGLAGRRRPRQAAELRSGWEPR